MSLLFLIVYNVFILCACVVSLAVLVRSDRRVYCVLIRKGMISKPAWSVFLIRPPRESGDE